MLGVVGGTTGTNFLATGAECMRACIVATHHDQFQKNDDYDSKTAATIVTGP